MSETIDAGLDGLADVMVEKAREQLFQTIGKIVEDQLAKQVKQLFPVPDFLSSWNNGVDLTKKVTKYICDYFPKEEEDKLFLEVPVNPDGTPQADGFDCLKGVDTKELMKYVRMRVPRPDFVL